MGVEGWLEGRATCLRGQALKWRQWSRTRVTKSQFSLAANWEPAVLMDGRWSAANSSRDQNQGKEDDNKGLRFAIDSRKPGGMEAGTRRWMNRNWICFSLGRIGNLPTSNSFLSLFIRLPCFLLSDCGHCTLLHPLTPEGWVAVGLDPQSSPPAEPTPWGWGWSYMQWEEGACLGFLKSLADLPKHYLDQRYLPR